LRLEQAIEPPSQESIESAISILIEIGAFERAEKNSANKSEQVHLTPLGQHLAMLPMDARIAKVVVFGSILSCLDPIVTIAAALSCKSPFLNSTDSEIRDKQNELKSQLAGDVPTSDHLLLWKVFEKYINSKNKRQLCRDLYLSYETLEAIRDLRGQYLDHLENIGFYSRRFPDRFNKHTASPRVVKVSNVVTISLNLILLKYHLFRQRWQLDYMQM